MNAATNDHVCAGSHHNLLLTSVLMGFETLQVYTG